MKSVAIAAAAAVLIPAASLADDVALVLVNGEYRNYADERLDSFADRAVEALEAAGFAVRDARDVRLSGAAAEMADLRDRMEGADRAVVVLAGHFANDGTSSWFLGTDALKPDGFTVGAQALPVAPILQMLDSQQGTSALLVADSGANLTLGPDLEAGFAAGAPPQGIAVFAGPARGILDTLEEELLIPGRSLASAAERAPRSVRSSGFLSRAVSLLPGDPPDVDTEAEEEARLVEPDRTPSLPEIDSAALESALDLDRDARRAVQRDLEILGYDPRGIDGIFGPGTRAALRAWQEDTGFEPSGYLSGNQIVLLQERGARRARDLEAEAAARQAEQDRRDTAAWRETGATGTEEGLRTYLERFPDGLYAERAREALEPFEERRRQEAEREDFEAWQEARNEGTTGAYRRYLEANPEGAFRNEAQARIEALAHDEGTAEARAQEARIAVNAIVRLLIEERLDQLGADPGRIDGTFDEATRRAIRRFQQARNLPVSGYVTQATMARLLAG